MKLSIRSTLVLSIGMLFLIGGCRNGHSTAKDHGKESNNIVRVQVVQPQQKTLTLTTNQPGRIEAFEQTPVFAKIEGYIAKTREVTGKDGKKEKKPIADIGDPVKEGEALAEVLVPEMVEELKQKQALIAQAKAGEEQAAKAVLVAAKAIGSAKAKINEAQAGVTRANGDHDFAKAELQRISELAQGGSLTKKLVEEAQSRLTAAEAGQQAAKAKVELATAALAEAEAYVAKVKADEVAAQARAKVAQADFDHTKTMLDYAIIRAPYDGVVTERKVDSGHFVRPPQGGAKPLFIVASVDVVRVVVEVPEKEAALVTVGAEALVNVAALTGGKIKGKVTRTAWALDFGTRTLRTEIDLPNKNGLLRPGLYTTVQITLKETPKTLTIPFKAVVHDKDRTYCCSVAAGKIVRHEITLGLRAGDEVEVLTGLKGTEAVVREFAATLKEGQAVEIVEAK